MKTIIVATDFSQEARNATDYILPLAKIRNYRIVLFYLKNVSIHALNAGLDSCSIDNILEQEKRAGKPSHQGRELGRAKRPAERPVDYAALALRRAELAKDAPVPTRITSYNVCYTKLLRSMPWGWIRSG